MTNLSRLTPAAISKALGERLKQARLNANLSQATLADLAGVSKTAVAGAESGRTTLDTFVTLLAALSLTEQLDSLLPEQPVSPIQLAKMQGRRRKRASPVDPKAVKPKKGDLGW